jgi:hypothetical protein
MKAKDLTQADVGKWVKLTLTMKVDEFDEEDGVQPVKLIVNKINFYWPESDTTLEFTDPPAPEFPEVGDVFKNLGSHPAEWTIAFIDGDACLMRYLTGHVSADYPLNPDLWEFVRKGTAS